METGQRLPSKSSDDDQGRAAHQRQHTPGTVPRRVLSAESRLLAPRGSFVAQGRELSPAPLSGFDTANPFPWAFGLRHPRLDLLMLTL
jgi:hypothetical protein